ncbi:uncharacterized transmembrane protein DDB_G0289901-like [Ostrea edulis]|uniref:uncharacterized transmembrane protein DDB_G0289901-like n=1 Tax=Ostrea edulis TaxID=37623 RepID=UPI0024AEEE1F|nr:uncharacterized transmembrane protein DDB_G0289901-like [Ostrea edulis]
MIRAIALLCLIAGAFAIPVPRNNYPKPGCGQYGCSHNIHFNGHSAATSAAASGLNAAASAAAASNQGFSGHQGVIDLNNGFNAGLIGGNSAAASAAASGFNAAASAAAASNRGFNGHQGVIGLNNGFDAGLIGGNAAAASAAASGFNAAASAAAASNRGFNGHQGVIGLNNEFNAGVMSGNSVATSPQNVGPFNILPAYQAPGVHYPSGPVFNGVGDSSAAASASSANMGPRIGMGGFTAPQFTNRINNFMFNPILTGQNPGAAAASAAASASQRGAASAAAAASSANLRSGIGMGGLIGSQLTGHLNGPVIQPFQGVPYPVGPLIGQNPGAAAAAAGFATSNGAASASAAASGSQGFIDGGILQGRSPRIINSNIVPGRKVY